MAVVLMASGTDDSPDEKTPAESTTSSPRPSFSIPTELPSKPPSELPTSLPSGFPTELPSGFPTELPSGFPSDLESLLPSLPDELP